MNFNLKKFLLELIGLSGVVLILILLAGQLITKQNLTNEILLGYLISLVIFLLGFISINWAFHRSLKTFMGVVLGGMFVRFVLIGVALFLLIRYTKVHLFSFILVFVVFYFIYQIYEIRFLNLKLSKGKQWRRVVKNII